MTRTCNAIPCSQLSRDVANNIHTGLFLSGSIQRKLWVHGRGGNGHDADDFNLFRPTILCQVSPPLIDVITDLGLAPTNTFKYILSFFCRDDRKRHNFKIRNFYLDFIPCLATVICFPVPCPMFRNMPCYESGDHMILFGLPIVNFAVQSKWWSFNLLQYLNNIKPGY